MDVCERVGLRSVEKQCPASQKLQSELEDAKAEVRAFMNGAIHTCNGIPGWWKVGDIDMTDPTQECPAGLDFKDRSALRLCGSSHAAHDQCSTAYFNVSGREYSQVCGRIQAYQFGTTRTFYPNSNTITLDGRYVDGVSLTHGSVGSREHIWTFASATGSGFVNRNIGTVSV